MLAVQEVRKGDEKYALFIKKEVDAGDGIKFLTEHEDSLQLGVMERPKGYKVEPHQHPERNVPVTRVAETLFILEGTIKATVFDEEWEVLAEQELSAGDFLLFLRGGHSIEVLDDARIVEVKQGPFLGDDGAKVFQDSV